MSDIVDLSDAAYDTDYNSGKFELYNNEYMFYWWSLS